MVTYLVVRYFRVCIDAQLYYKFSLLAIFCFRSDMDSHARLDIVSKVNGEPLLPGQVERVLVLSLGKLESRLAVTHARNLIMPQYLQGHDSEENQVATMDPFVAGSDHRLDTLHPHALGSPITGAVQRKLVPSAILTQPSCTFQIRTALQQELSSQHSARSCTSSLRQTHRVLLLRGCGQSLVQPFQ